MNPYFTTEELHREYADLLPPQLSIRQLLGTLRDAGDKTDYLVTEDDVAKYIVTLQSMPSDRRTLKAFLETLPITVGAKVKSGSARKILDFIMNRYTKPRVALVLHDWVVYLHARQAQISPDDSVETRLDAIENRFGPFGAYTIGIMMNDEECREAARARYPEGAAALFGEEYEHEAFVASAVLLQSHYIGYAMRKYQALHQALITNEALTQMENIIQNQRTHLTRLDAKLDRAARRTARLKKELDDTQKTGEELLDEALAKIKTLETQLEQERKQYARDIADLFEQMSELIRQRDDTGEPRAKRLAGLAVAVIGDDSHKNTYRDVIEDIFGGEMRFCTGLETSPRLRSVSKWADIIILITRYMQHKTEQAVKAEMRPGTPIIHVNAAGAASFFRAVQEFAAGAVGERG